MFALPQATTSAVRPAKAGDKSTPDKVDDSKSSVFGGGGRASATSAESMPSTPRTRPSGDTDISSILVGSTRGSNGGGRHGERYGTLTPISSAQTSINTNSPSSARQQKGDGVKQTQSFLGAFGLKSKKSNTALSPRNVSAETWQTIASDDTSHSTSNSPDRFSQRAPTPASSTGFFNRTRAKISPRTPADHILASPKSMSSLMSTDSVSTIATVSPVGRSPVPCTPIPPTPLRYSSVLDGAETSMPSVNETLPNIFPDDDSVMISWNASRVKNGSIHSFSVPSPATPAVCKKRSQIYMTEKFLFDENGRKHQYARTKATLDQFGLPSAELAETNPQEWSGYVEAVKREIRKQEQREIREPLGALPRDGTSKEMHEYDVRKRDRTHDKVKLATQFLHRTSSCGFLLKDGWQEGYPQELSLYETIAEWERKYAKQDPDMKKTVLKQLFKKIKQKSSSPSISSTPTTDLDRTPTCRDGSTGKMTYDDASDRALASTPDQDHYQEMLGLGISASSTSILYQAPRILSTTDSAIYEDPSQAISTAEPSAESTLQSYTSTPVTPRSSPVGLLLRDDMSGWETVTDEEVDIDDDLIEAANAFGSTPDLRRKFKGQEYGNLLHPHAPPVPHLSPEVRERYENQALPVPPSVPRHSSFLLVRRDSTRRAFSPKLESEAQQADFDRGIQAAAQRRTEKLSKVPVATSHPALRIDTGHSLNARSTSLPLQVSKICGSELPTPTKAKPVKPAKPPSLGTQLALRKVQEGQPPPGVASQLPRPPRYGQRVSPGKSLDSPKASDGAGNYNSATPLPLPNRYAPITEIPPSNCRSTTAQPDEDDNQESVSPVDDHMDNVVNAWRGPRTPSMPNLPSYDESTSMHEAQRMREHLGLPLLEHKPETDPPHPNHKYAWDTVNLMCMGIHRGAYEPMNASPSQVSMGHRSPLRGFGGPSSAIRIESYNTFNSINFNYQGKGCHICGKTCCHYAEQLDVMKAAHVRNPIIQAAVATARTHEQELRQKFPGGVERYDAHIKCSDCGIVCCHEHGVVCKTLSCRAALCAGCSENLGGRCRQHRDRVAEAIQENGVRTDSLVRSLQERIDDQAVNKLIDLL